MQLPTEVFGEVVVVHTPEELTDDNARGLEPFLRSLEHRRIVVDLDTTENIDSSGLEALLDCLDTAIEMGGDLKVSTTNASNRKVLEMTRLDQQLEIYYSVIEAVKSFV